MLLTFSRKKLTYAFTYAFTLKKLTAYVNESSGQNKKIKIVFVVSYKKKFIMNSPRRPLFSETFTFAKYWSNCMCHLKTSYQFYGKVNIRKVWKNCEFSLSVNLNVCERKAIKLIYVVDRLIQPLYQFIRTTELFFYCCCQSYNYYFYIFKLSEEPRACFYWVTFISMFHLKKSLRPVVVSHGLLTSFRHHSIPRLCVPFWSESPSPGDPPRGSQVPEQVVPPHHPLPALGGGGHLHAGGQKWRRPGLLRRLRCLHFRAQRCLLGINFFLIFYKLHKKQESEDCLQYKFFH